jgi:hypothetical protein
MQPTSGGEKDFAPCFDADFFSARIQQSGSLEWHEDVLLHLIIVLYQHVVNPVSGGSNTWRSGL